MEPLEFGPGPRTLAPVIPHFHCPQSESQVARVR
jgi:hypothetical protein